MVKSTNVLDVLKLFSSWVLVKTPGYCLQNNY